MVAPGYMVVPFKISLFETEVMSGAVVAQIVIVLLTIISLEAAEVVVGHIPTAATDTLAVTLLPKAKVLAGTVKDQV